MCELNYNQTKDGIMKKQIITAAALLLVGISQSHAQEAEDIIKYREAVMKAYAGHMGASARIVRGKVDIYKDQLKMHAMSINSIAKTVGDLFPVDSDFGNTRAKPEVWEKKDEFAKAVKANQDAAADFSKTVAGGDMEAIGKSFKALSDTCKSCHEDFRTEEE
jgi:cytochrome c556